MKDKAPKRKWGSIIFLVFIVIGLSVSATFIGFGPESGKVKYNGIAFSGNGQVWTAKINGKQSSFSFLPAETEDIKINGDFVKVLAGKYEIDVTSQLNDTSREPIALAAHQMGLTLGAHNVFVRAGFTTNNSFSFPVITCNNATQYIPVVHFRRSNSTSINAQGNCIIAEASSNADVIRVKDRLVYGILGVMK